MSEKCPTCGSQVTVAGDETRYYVPVDVEKQTVDRCIKAIMSANIGENPNCMMAFGVVTAMQAIKDEFKL